MATQPGLSYVTTNRELRVDLDGSYRLSIWSPAGKELFSLAGSGRKGYHPAPFREPGLYVVKSATPTRNYVQKIMVY